MIYPNLTQTNKPHSWLCRLVAGALWASVVAAAADVLHTNQTTPPPLLASASFVTQPRIVASINTGGPSFTDSNGRLWEADSLHRYYNASSPTVARQTSATILATNDDVLYQTDRTFRRTHSMLTSPVYRYEIPVPESGAYIVTLHFAEMDPLRALPGRRLFDIIIEGAMLRSNFDIVAAAGAAYTATTLSTNATRVEDGFVTIEFKSVKFHPKVSAISVVQTKVDSSNITNNHWHLMAATGTLDARHEACFVMVGSRAYLVGGRDNLPVNVYNPSTRTWTREPGPGLKLHHMQCVVADAKIWIVSAWTGNCCQEPNVPSIYIYDTVTKTWTTKAGLPEPRRRGGGAAVLRGREIYLVAGNRGGHGAGKGQALPWFDKYNIDTNVWTTHLPDAPRSRDHTGGAMVGVDTNNTLLCIASGRDSGAAGDYFNATVLPTDCFNFLTFAWESRAPIPQGRAGAAVAATCDGTQLVVAGGEGYKLAWDRVDVFDGIRWQQTLPPLQSARHGTGLAFDCERNQIYMASGSGAQGGEPELNTTETYSSFPLQ